MKLKWTRLAASDRREIREYVAQSDLAAALDLDKLFQRKAVMLLNQPNMGRPGRVVGTRELVAHRHYILIYDLAGDLVRILRVLHTARQWPPAGK